MKGPDQWQPPFEPAAGEGAPARRGLRRLVPAIVVLALLAVAYLGGFALFATHVSRLATPSGPIEADAIIVLTGGHARLDAAMDLLETGGGQRLLISGVNPVARPIDLQRASGADPAMFSCCVDIDRAALDTIGNAQESAKWVNAHSYGRVILVTNNYHMPRSLLELGRMVGEAELIPYPVVNTRLDGARWLVSREALRVLFPEYTKLIAAFARGLLPPREPPSGAAVVDAVGAGG